MMQRRAFLMAMSAGTVAPVLRAQFGTPVRCPGSHGDLWTATWAGDDALYVASDDTTGFNKACNSNLAVHRITGSMPPALLGETMNPMSEYGTQTQRRPEDGGMWKASGLIAVDGVLYLAVSRHGRPNSRFAVQETWDATIVKSLDYGKTWSGAPKLGQAMFPGRIFSNPFFVQYGKDGEGTGEFVYAVSSDGVWNNGSTMSLGRVRRDRIGRLDARDWEFVQRYDPQSAPVWGIRHDIAQFVFRAPGRTSMTGIHYVAPLRIYIMPQWHYPNQHQPHPYRWRTTRIELYQAPQPWGPWALFHSQEFTPEAWYNPCIPSKFVSADGSSLWLFVAGDFTRHEEPGGPYGLHMIPVRLSPRGA